MSKTKAIILVVLLVGLAGGGALFGSASWTSKLVIEQAQAELAATGPLVVDRLRVFAFGMIQHLANLSLDEASLATLSKAPSNASGSEEEIRSALTSTHDGLLATVGRLHGESKLSSLTLLAADGRQLASAPTDVWGQSLQGIPAVRDCLSGVMRDGFIELDGKLIQLAVAPIGDPGRTVGCWMASRPLVASDLAKECGVDLALFLRKALVGSSLGVERIKPLESRIDSPAPISFGDPEGGSPLLANLSGRAYLASMVEVPADADVFQLAVIAPVANRLEPLRRTQMMILYAIIGLLVLGAAFALLFGSSGPDRQVFRLRDSVRLLLEGNGTYSIDQEQYSGPYQEVVSDINRLAERPRTGSPAASRGPESVSQILGPIPGGAGSGADEDEPAGDLDFESLLGGGSLEPPRPTPAAPPPPAVAAPTEPPSAPIRQAPPIRPAPPPRPPMPPPPVNLRSQPPAPAPVTAADEGARGPRVPVPGDLASFFDEESTREVDPLVPDEARPGTDESPGRSVDSGFQDNESLPDLDDGDDSGDQITSSDYKPDATVIAQVPDELLKAASSSSSSPSGPRRGQSVPPPPVGLPRPPVGAHPLATSRSGASPEEAHFREVFDQFLQTKRQCGEPTAGTTYEKFVDKLRKNTSDLKSRFRCSSVRFQVYVKDGKAALKATPVK